MSTMKFIIRVIFLIKLFINIETNDYSDSRYILKLLRKLNDADNDDRVFKLHNSNTNEHKNFKLEDRNNAIHARNKIKHFKNKKNRNYDVYPIVTMTTHSTIDREQYRMDPVLNFIGRRTRQNNVKRNKKKSEDSSGSSIETKDWKMEWNEHWINKNFETINTTVGDAVNMVAARPRGVPCGDPNQHDMPWGNCMLTIECEPEFRIYKGDYYCGRTQYVCCAVKLHSYDMYQGFDVSFADTSKSSDIENRQKDSREARKKEKRKQRRILKKERRRRKRKMKKNIKKTIKDITKILNKSYHNATTVKKRISKQLKKFIDELKEQYKNDRPTVNNIYELNLKIIDNSLQEKINEIKEFNKQFITNSTFREAVVSGKVDK